MEAAKHSCKAWPLLILAVTLAGCQATQISPRGTVAEEHPALKIFNSALLATPEPDSIVREGNRITYMVIAHPEPASSYLARFDADCTLPDAQMAFASRNAMKHYTDDAQVTESSQLPAPQKSLYLQSAQLKQLCAQTAAPDWRVFSASQQPVWQMFDRANLKTEGDNVTFWTAKVFPSELLLPDTNIVYGQIRQRWTANCARQQQTERSTFYINKNGRLIYGVVQKAPQAIDVRTLGADERELLQRLCEKPQSLDAYKPFAGRTQSPFELPVPVPAASVAKAIEALNMPEPRRSIKHLRLAYKNTGGAPGSRMGRDLNYLPIEAGQQLTERAGSGREQSVKVSFRGLIHLASSQITAHRDQFKVWNSALTDLQFQGNWARMPVGEILHYTITFNHDRKTPQTRAHRCEVQAQKPASTYHLSLEGTAKIIKCEEQQADPADNSAVYAYLETYGLFMQVQIIEGIWNGEWVIDALE